MFGCGTFYGVLWDLKVDCVSARTLRGPSCSGYCRGVVAACREDSFYDGMDPPKPRGCCFHRMASLPSSWLLWTIRRCRLDCCGGCLGCTCPRFFSDKFHLEILDHRGQLRPTFKASNGAQQPLGLKLCDPLAQPSRVHVLTGAHSYPDRPLDRRRVRHRRPRHDGQRSWARCHGRCRRHQPLRRPRRHLKRGALVQCMRTCARRVHASDHLLTDTNSL